MKKKHDHHHKLDTLHPMDSFGVVSGVTKQVRVTRLEGRLTPIVPFPHKHNFYHLVIITKGSGWHEIDFKKYLVSRGAVFFMLPAQVHSWSMSKETKGIVIEFEGLSMFSGDDSYNIFSDALMPLENFFHVNGEKRDDIFLLAQKMLLEYEEEKKNFEIVLQLYLATLILTFSRHLEGKAAKVGRVSKFREDFSALVEKNYKKHHGVDFYARTLGITSKALTAKVNRIIGKSVREFVQERCILESKRLLAYSDLTVSEISLELGFEDPNYFTRFFSSKTKQTPGKFRQKSRQVC